MPTMNVVLVVKTTSQKLSFGFRKESSESVQNQNWAVLLSQR